MLQIKPSPSFSYGPKVQDRDSGKLARQAGLCTFEMRTATRMSDCLERKNLPALFIGSLSTQLVHPDGAKVARPKIERMHRPQISFRGNRQRSNRRHHKINRAGQRFRNGAYDETGIPSMVSATMLSTTLFRSPVSSKILSCRSALVPFSRILWM